MMCSYSYLFKKEIGVIRWYVMGVENILEGLSKYQSMLRIFSKILMSGMWVFSYKDHVLASSNL